MLFGVRQLARSCGAECPSACLAMNRSLNLTLRRPVESGRKLLHKADLGITPSRRMPTSWFGVKVENEAQALCSEEALNAGLTSAAKTGALSTALVLAVSNFFPAFNRKLSVSSKTALCIMPPFFMFALRSELTLSACSRRHAMLKQAVHH